MQNYHACNIRGLGLKAPGFISEKVSIERGGNHSIAAGKREEGASLETRGEDRDRLAFG